MESVRATAVPAGPYAAEPPIPPGRPIALPRRGTTFVREVKGPPGAPTLLLLHGWIASGALNWFRVFQPLSRHFNVIAPDLRGHARGVRSNKLFRLADCADDCAQTLVELDTGPVIVVGYSMGGPVAQLLWRRHRDLVDGLVFCATAGSFIFGTRERALFTSAMAAAAGTTRVGGLVAGIPGMANWGPLTRDILPSSRPGWVWGEVRRHNWRMLLEAGHSLGTYNAGRWLSEIDVPTAVMVTQRDRALAPEVQLGFRDAIAGASMHPVDDGHRLCQKESFGSPLVDACGEVAARLASRS
jgi:3-oxoadipate enol-lactonase